MVGGGLGGLLVARGLRAAGHEVTVVEASDRLGGQIHTVDFCGLPADTGAEAMFLGAPGMADLIDDLGLTDELVGPRAGASWLARGRRLIRLPEGVGPTGPTQIKPVLHSGLLGPFALARAAMEPLRAKPITEDLSVGDFVSRRFGRRVTDVFVDPLLGNLHAGDINRLSLHATAAQLRPVAVEGRSILKNAAARPPRPSDAPPLFASFPQGLQRLIDALSDDLRARGVQIFTNTRVTALERLSTNHQPWRVHATSGTQRADHIALTAGMATTVDLLRPHLPAAADLLSQTLTATVASVLLAYPRDAVTEPMADANGILLNSTSGRMMKAATFLSRKWEHLDDDEVFVVRASAGRARSDVLDLVEDRQLVQRLHAELADLVQVRARPVASTVTRWPHSYPQLEVGHLARMTELRSLLSGSGLVVGGHAIDGLGLPSVLRSARSVVADLS